MLDKLLDNPDEFAWFLNAAYFHELPLGERLLDALCGALRICESRIVEVGCLWRELRHGGGVVR